MAGIWTLSLRFTRPAPYRVRFCATNRFTGSLHLGDADDPDAILSLVLWPPGCASRVIAMDALKQTDRTWRVAYSTRSIGLIKRALLSGPTLGVMKASYLPKSLQIVDGQIGLPPLPDVAI